LLRYSVATFALRCRKRLVWHSRGPRQTRFLVCWGGQPPSAVGFDSEWIPPCLCASVVGVAFPDLGDVARSASPGSYSSPFIAGDRHWMPVIG